MASGSGPADPRPVQPSPRGEHSLSDTLPAAGEARASGASSKRWVLSSRCLGHLVAMEIKTVPDRQ